MDFLFINTHELSALMGLPYIQQVTYLRGIRPYMDRQTFVVGGAKRRISYQALSEALYVEPHQGYVRSGSPGRQQIRRIIKGLEKAGLIEIQSFDKHLILKCLLANAYFYDQNKPDTNPTQQPDTTQNLKKNNKSNGYNEISLKPNTVKNIKPDTPHNSQNHFIYLQQQFEKFWSLYPEKKSKQKAQAIFEQLNPDTNLFQHLMEALQTQINHAQVMQGRSNWIPPWKYPANWLAQRCWEDELSMDVLQENSHATHTKSTRKPNNSRDLFCPPCNADDESTNHNVIQFRRHLQNGETY